MEMEICVGSSCHLKGASLVVKKLLDYIEHNHLNERVHLRGSFCLGACTHGVSVRVGDQVYSMDEENCLRMLKEMLEGHHATD